MALQNISEIRRMARDLDDMANYTGRAVADRDPQRARAMIDSMRHLLSKMQGRVLELYEQTNVRR